MWGQTGMRKLWGASNVRVYGGGAAEEEFLSDLEKLIGEYNRLVASPSSRARPGRRQHQHQLAADPDADPHRRRPRRACRATGSSSCPPARRRCSPSPSTGGTPAKPQQIRESIATYDPPQSSPAATPRNPPQEAPWTTTGVSAGQPTRVARRRGAAGRADRAQRARAARRVRHAQGARPARERAARRRARSSSSPMQAAERQLAELADPPGLYYLTLDEWVQEWLFPVYRRSVRGHERVWCPQWWKHAEAVARLEAAVASVGAPAPGPGHRPVGVVSRPRRPPHDGSARRRRAVQRLRRPPLRAPARGAAPRPAARGHVRTRGLRRAATAAAASSAPAAARNAGRAREHTIRRSR